MKSTERHKLKENELARTVEHARDMVSSRQNDIVRVAVIAVVLIALVGGFTWWRQAQFTKASAALAAGLARAGVEVELLTSRFLYGPVPPAEGYEVRELFYGRSAARGLDAPARRAFKFAEHLPGMLRLRGATAAADVVHYQWLTVPGLDARILPPSRPRLMTAHYVLPPTPTSRRLRSPTPRSRARSTSTSPPPTASRPTW